MHAQYSKIAPCRVLPCKDLRVDPRAKGPATMPPLYTASVEGDACARILVLELVVYNACVPACLCARVGVQSLRAGVGVAMAVGIQCVMLRLLAFLPAVKALVQLSGVPLAPLRPADLLQEFLVVLFRWFHAVCKQRCKWCVYIMLRQHQYQAARAYMLCRQQRPVPSALSTPCGFTSDTRVGLRTHTSSTRTVSIPQPGCLSCEAAPPAHTLTPICAGVPHCGCR